VSHSIKKKNEPLVDSLEGFLALHEETKRAADEDEAEASDTERGRKRARRVIGVMGLGSVGRSLVRKLLAEDVRVVTYDRKAPAEPGAEHHNWLPGMLRIPGLEVAIDTTRGRKLSRSVPTDLYCPMERWSG